MKNKKTIFTVLSKTDELLINYAALLAKRMGLDVVLYLDNSSIYTEVYRVSKRVAKAVGIKINVSHKKANTYSWLNSILLLAEKENSEMILMNVAKENIGFFGETIWDRNQKIDIPIMVLPEKFIFKEIKNIVIPVDFSVKIRKNDIVMNLAKAFDSKVSIFKHNEQLNQNKKTIDAISRNLSILFKEVGINSAEIASLHKESFAIYLGKYCSKNGDLLLIEVDPEAKDKDRKREILLSHNKPVLLQKTKRMGFWAIKLKRYFL